MLADDVGLSQLKPVLKIYIFAWTKYIGLMLLILYVMFYTHLTEIQDFSREN